MSQDMGIPLLLGAPDSGAARAALSLRLMISSGDAAGAFQRPSACPTRGKMGCFTRSRKKVKVKRHVADPATLDLPRFEPGRATRSTAGASAWGRTWGT